MRFDRGSRFFSVPLRARQGAAGEREETEGGLPDDQRLRESEGEPDSLAGSLRSRSRLLRQRIRPGPEPRSGDPG